MRIATALVLFGLARGAFAQGGPPLRTDDPGTPGDGRWEFNLAATYESAAGTRLYELPLVDINYGLGERLQLKYEVPWVHLDEPGAPADDFGESVAGVKWRFQDGGERSPALSVYPQVSFGEVGTGLMLPIQASWDLGPLALGAEVGHEFRDVGSGGWIAGLSCSRRTSERCELLAEVHGEASVELDRSTGVINVGTRAELGPGFTLLASVGTGLWSDRSERPDLIAYLGLQLRL